jgi:hypothetical protein
MSTFDLRDIVFDSVVPKWTTLYVVERYDSNTHHWWAERYFDSLASAKRYQLLVGQPTRICEEKLWR